MSERKPVLPALTDWIDLPMATAPVKAELRAAEAVIRAVRGVCVKDKKGGWEWIGGEQFHRLARAIARLDAATGRKP